MALIQKSYSFDAAHDLPGHKGKCASYHGHTYRVDVSIAGEIRDCPYEEMHEFPVNNVVRRYELNSDDGMVMDFYELDQVMKPLIDHDTGYFDHHYLNETLTGIPRTTAELIACWIYGSVVYSVPSLRGDDWAVFVRVWETPTCYAEVGETDWLRSGSLGVDIFAETEA